MTQTAVEWLIEQLEERVYRIGYKNNRIYISISFEDFMSINKQAKRMEDEQRLEAWRGGIDSTEAGGKSYDQYYNKTYGNKSDNHTEQHIEMLSYQTEISDEEIEKAAHIQYPVNLQPNGRTLAGGRYDIDINYSERNAYILSAKWMRDKIQNK